MLDFNIISLIIQLMHVIFENKCKRQDSYPYVFVFAKMKILYTPFKIAMSII